MSAPNEHVQSNNADRDDLRLRMRLGILGVPIVLLHVALVTNFVTLPQALAWLGFKFGYAAFVFGWANGALLVFLHWCWTRKRMPVSRTAWIEGDQARRRVLHMAGLVVIEILVLFLRMAGPPRLW